MGDWMSDFDAAFSRKLLSTASVNTQSLNGRIRRGELYILIEQGVRITYPIITFQSYGATRSGSIAGVMGQGTVRVWVWSDKDDVDYQCEIMENIRQAVNNQTIRFGTGSYIVQCDRTSTTVPKTNATKASAVVVDWTVRGLNDGQ